MNKLSFKHIYLFVSLFMLLSMASAQDGAQKQLQTKPEINKSKDGFSLEKISYNENTMVLHIKIVIPKGESTFTLYGSYTSQTWYINNTSKSTQSFPLIEIRNVKKNNVLEDEKLTKGQQNLYEVKPGDVITCEAVYKLIPDAASSINLTQGMTQKSDNIIFNGIKLLPDFLVKSKEVAQNNTNTTNNTTTNNTQTQTNETVVENITQVAEDWMQTVKLLLDSVELKRKAGDFFTVAKLNGKIAGLFSEHSKFNEAITYLQNALDVYVQQNNKVEESTTSLEIGNNYYFSGNKTKSIDYYKRSLAIEESTGNLNQVASIYNNIATVYESQYRYEDAIENYVKGLETKKKENDTQGVGRFSFKIGNVYYTTENYAKAIEFFKDALSIDQQAGNKDEIAASQINIGNAYYMLNDFGNSQVYLNQGLTTGEAAGNKSKMAAAYNVLGNVQYDQQKYEDASKSYLKAIDLNAQANNKRSQALTLFNLGNTYRKQKDLDKALTTYEQSKELAAQSNYNEVLYNDYEAIAEVMAEKNNCSATLDNYKEYTQIRFATRNEKRRQLTEMQTKYLRKEQSEKSLLSEIEMLYGENQRKTKELDKALTDYRIQKEIAEQQKQISELERENTRKQKTIIYFLIGGMLLFIVLSFIIFRQYKQKQKANVELKMMNQQINQAKEEIEAQRDEIDKQHKEVIIQRDQIKRQNESITDSITYARRIQEAILPPAETFTSLLPSYFILYKPRDIVSGDFYWIQEVENKVVVVAADCTGHGVPGAFMSMLGVQVLNEVVSKIDKLEADLIMKKLREYVMTALHQTGKDGEAKDGMDMALCIFDFKANSVQFSGANNPLYVVRKKESNVEYVDNDDIVYSVNDNYVLMQYRASKQPIGVSYAQKDTYSAHNVQLKKGDTMYIFSDGYCSQLGGPQERKFVTKKFKEMLLELQSQSLEQQKQHLDTFIEGWKGVHEQTDDILVMSVRV